MKSRPSTERGEATTDLARKLATGAGLFSDGPAISRALLEAVEILRELDQFVTEWSDLDEIIVNARAFLAKYDGEANTQIKGVRDERARALLQKS